MKRTYSAANGVLLASFPSREARDNFMRFHPGFVALGSPASKHFRITVGQIRESRRNLGQLVDASGCLRVSDGR